jgi:S1-C subfamily serine protease
VLRNGKSENLTMKLVAAPETPPRQAVTISGRSPFTGATFWNISPAVNEELSLESFREGVVAVEVPEGSIASSVGLQKGDVVLSVNDTKISRTSDLEKATTGRKPYWKLTIGRGGQVFTTVMGG